MDLYNFCYRCKKTYSIFKLKISWRNDGHNGDYICRDCYNDTLSLCEYIKSFFYDNF
jgi:hypothetical protein